MVKRPYARTLFLVADGFDEAAIGFILAKLRQAGLAADLVGLRTGKIRSRHGLTIVPNTNLERVLEAKQPTLALIIPDGASHLTRLASDPRINILFRQSLIDQSILVGLGGQAIDFIATFIGSAKSDCKIVELDPNRYLGDFAATLIDQLLVQ
jgi:hypothetical protein